MDKNYYQILGVNEKASKEEIKKAFHKLAHRYHPDKKGGDEKKFKEVNEAFHVLFDDSKRAQYDAMRRGGFGGGQSSGFGAGGGFDWNFADFARGGGEGLRFDFGDLFNDLFSGGGARARRGRDISVDIEISFSEAVFGTRRNVLITKIGECEVCRGSGAKPGTKLGRCGTCGGKGRIEEVKQSFLGSFATLRDCGSCRGTGEVPEERCVSCGGIGVLRKAEEIAINVPPGIEGGEMIRLAGKGEAAAGGAPGDLYVRVHVERHPLFRREGANLVSHLTIKLSDALLGAEYPLETLDGNIKLKIPAGIGSGEILRIKGKGVPQRGGRRGDLLITVKVKMPGKLTKKLKAAIEELKAEGF